MPFRALASLSILVVLSACRNSPTVPLNPQIKTNRNSVGFGSEQGFGVFVGTSVQDSLDIQNTGTHDLVISSVSVTGDNAFTYQGPQPMQVAGLQHSAVSFYFRPPASGTYSATFTINSNAENASVKTITLAGTGVNPDGGM